MNPAEVSFLSHGITCAAWHVKATSNDLLAEAGRPCVVMAHGFGGTRDSGLLAYADSFARAGIDSFVFDYRGFGSSDGSPRQNVVYKHQREDYHAALEVARHLVGVDPDRIALWGTSYSAGHVIAVAAQRRDRRDVAGIVSMTPAVDGFAALGNIARYAGVGQLAWATREGLRDALRAATDKPPHLIPIVGPPGSKAMMTTKGASAAFEKMAGPTAVNEVCARHALEAARNRPTIYAARVACPMLIQIGTNDQVAPPSVAQRMAKKARSRTAVLTYPLDHFDVYDDPWRSVVSADQVDFLSRLFTR
jgi:pimeloyl-ACP methyl ester carboxylesterase